MAQVVISLARAGMEQVVKILSLGLHQDNFLVSVICCFEKGPLSAELERAGIQVLVPPGRHRILSLLYPTFLSNALKSFRPDIVHSHSGCWYPASKAARMTNVPVVVHTEHGRGVPDSRLMMFMDRLSASRTDCLACVSEKLSDYMKHTVHISPSLVTLVPNGIDIDLFSPVWHRMSYPLRSFHGFPSDARVLVSVGRMETLKGHRYLIAAFARLRQKYDFLRLWILGDGRLKEQTKAMVTDLGMSDDIVLPGSVPNVADYLRESDLFVLPSLSEGTSMAILEAMASGLPIVACDVGGNRDILSRREIGLLVAPASPSALEDAIQEIILDPVRCYRLGREAHGLAHEEYSSQAMVKHYERIYSKLLEKGKGRP